MGARSVGSICADDTPGQDRTRGSKMLTKGGNDHPISVAFGVEENSRMPRSDIVDLTVFVAIADNRSFRAVAPRLGVRCVRTLDYRDGWYALWLKDIPEKIARSLRSRIDEPAQSTRGRGRHVRPSVRRRKPALERR